MCCGFFQGSRARGPGLFPAEKLEEEKHALDGTRLKVGEKLVFISLVFLCSPPPSIVADRITVGCWHRDA